MPPVTTQPALTRRVRAGYGVGSVATGAFGTVPGLMLLPYLTDTLGVTAALWLVAALTWASGLVAACRMSETMPGRVTASP